MDENEVASQHFLDSSRFWIQRVFVPLMVCMGVGGNTITVMVLTRKRMRCSTNVYLTALAIADIVYLFFVLVLSFEHYENIHDKKYALFWRFYGIAHWLTDAASSTSVWLTVSFTLERYIAVCHPIRGKVLCTESRAKNIIVVVVITCILLTASTSFEYQLAVGDDCSFRNCTLDELSRIEKSSGNSLHNTTIHYLSDHNIVVTKFPKDLSQFIKGQLISDPDSSSTSARSFSSSTSTSHLINEMYEEIKPQLDTILPANCTSHPHVIFMPIFLPIKNHSNNISVSKINGNLIESEDNKGGVMRKLLAQNSSILDQDDMVFDNGTCCTKKYMVDIEPTTLGDNKTYQKIIYYVAAICFWFVPLILIATFNCFLVHAVYNSQKRRRRMTNNSQENVSLSNENRITIMLIGVVVLFLVCQTPTGTFMIYMNLSAREDKTSTNIKLGLGNIFNFLVTVNAACNFLLYCVLSRKFRTTFHSLFFNRKKNTNRQDTLVLSSTRSRSENRFTNSYKNGFKRNISQYSTPRNLETQSLTAIPRSKSLMTRAPGKAKSSDMNF